MRAFLAAKFFGATIFCALLAGCGSIPQSPANAQKAAIYQQVTAAAIAEGVPVDIAHGVVKAESNYSQNERSRSGALGVMQVLPSTARAMGEDARAVAHDVSANLRAGMRYLKKALQSAPGNLCAAISGYNHGIGGRPYCTAYGKKVLKLSGRS